MPKKQHLYEVDLMRTFIMMGVLSVHTITAYMAQLDPDSRLYLAVAALHGSLHFTRESFMFITGLVLFITYYHREFNPFKFWWKRLMLVGIPYVVWSILDTLWMQHNRPHPDYAIADLARSVGHLLAFGDNFHLYYVLVSVQLYIVFPLLLLFLRKFERWHLHVFVASFVAQLCLMAFYHFVLPGLHKGHWPYALATLAANHGTFVLTYQFWFVAGGIAACHYGQVLQFVQRHQRALWAVLAMGVVIMWIHYLFVRFVLHQSGSMAESVEQPLMVPYALLVTTAIWYAGVLWARRRERPRLRWFNRFVAMASKASFGTYLLQIYPLHFVQLATRAMNVPNWLFLGTIPFAILFVYLSSMLVAYGIGKIPGIALIVGRRVEMVRPNVSAAVQS
ncbi:MAG: acyltransferase [Alicyclobacillus sp.]|nr:acyltransferase [Alicyclobacillus sp.]